MKGDPRFTSQKEEFWALVRTLSEKLGYTHKVRKGQSKGSGALKRHSAEDLAAGLSALDLDPGLVLKSGRATRIGQRLVDYFAYCADVLEQHIEPSLMNARRAKALFNRIKKRVKPVGACPLPENKQKNEKKAPAYLTGIVNMLVHEAIRKLPCNYSPGQLTTFTRAGIPLWTLARRVDGAFPSAINPIAVWEIKEYYYTTTFGSRVADGVYETLLDGLELKQLQTRHRVRADHILVVDAHYTWWVCGKSYLCRIIDMLNMGLVSEAIFGAEVEERIPLLAKGWAKEHKARKVARANVRAG